MKKTISVILSLLFLMQSAAVYAEDADLSFDTVDVIISVKDGYCHSADANVNITLSDGDRTYQKEITIGEGMQTQKITFDVDSYSVDKEFKIGTGYQIEKLFWEEEAGQDLSVITQDGKINIEYIPAMHNAVKVIYNKKPLELSIPARNIGEHVIVPLKEMAELMEVSYTEAADEYKLSSSFSSLSVLGDEIYIERADATKIKEEIGVAPQNISGELFVPISAIASAFNLDLIMTMDEEIPTLYAATGDLSNVYIPNNTYVNEAGLSSDTDYLIWVSKSEYKVRVYMGTKGNFSQIKEFTCAIGAPRTPTCEGTYKYYQAQTMWDYGSYYVGPIMRFNGGYAMHSTLIYKNGTPKDNRVGMQLSLGCVRLQPPDIGWLAYYVPLYTTIHITG